MERAAGGFRLQLQSACRGAQDAAACRGVQATDACRGGQASAASFLNGHGQHNRRVAGHTPSSSRPHCTYMTSDRPAGDETHSRTPSTASVSRWRGPASPTHLPPCLPKPLKP